MVCIYCGSSTFVSNSRPQLKANNIWRRRVCVKCSAIFSSIEKADLEKALVVVKKNNKIEPFYRDKVFISIYKSLDHSSQPQVLAGSLTDTVIQQVVKSAMDSSVKSQSIAENIRNVLKKFDAASAIKYQSYRQKMKASSDVKKNLQ